MIERLQKYSGVVALVILAILGVSYFMGGSGMSFGATSCANITCLTGGLRLLSDTGGNFESNIASYFTSTMYSSSTVQTSGNLRVYTSDTATSTTAVGCIQTTATSTATPVKIIIGDTNSTASSTFASGSTGFVNWGYGNCP